MRHPLEGAARFASELTRIASVINAGDRVNHPDPARFSYSILKTQGTLDNLSLFMVGDLKYGRTVHLLLMAMQFHTTFNFVSPDELKRLKNTRLPELSGIEIF